MGIWQADSRESVILEFDNCEDNDNLRGQTQRTPIDLVAKRSLREICFDVLVDVKA